ncbi:hypothetical protein CSE16_08275 [Solibacillus sp. R5-41]|nr:hypothetical protein CSE16_08275 [Solibacillus sp. R5-41]
MQEDGEPQQMKVPLIKFKNQHLNLTEPFIKQHFQNAPPLLHNIFQMRHKKFPSLTELTCSLS